MDRSTILDRIKYLNLLSLFFSNTTVANSFTPQEIKKFFHLAMPPRWQTKFVNSGQDYLSSSLEIISTYMVQQEILTNAH